MKNFWKDLPRPFFVLAPLEDVTDAAFRRLIAEYRAPHATFTEFTSADGLLLADERGQTQLRRKLLFSDIERPIVAQLFSSRPERMEAAAKQVREMGFDGLDINMGCPARPVEKSGCGAALIKNPSRARELIAAAKRGACSCASQTCTGGTCIPVSVKTRLGYNQDELETWLPELLAEEPVAVTIHARTRKEMSKVPARWERIARAVEIRDALRSQTLIVGNGDLEGLDDAREKVAAAKCDGAMLGRAIFGNPWLFADRKDAPSPRERVEALARHLELFEELVADVVHFALMKKHFKSYISGWDGAKELRGALMDAPTPEAAMQLLSNSL